MFCCFYYNAFISYCFAILELTRKEIAMCYVKIGLDYSGKKSLGF